MPILSEDNKSGRRSPPAVPFVVSVGVTGHRGNALADGSRDLLRSRVVDALVLIEEVVRELHETNSRWFAPNATVLRFVSPLADGADQIAAEIAVSRGWELHAILPFSRSDYRTSLGSDADRRSLDELLSKSSRVLELPGSRDDPTAAYVMTARGTVAHCDLLMAIWDGEPARGPGGTADVVQLALSRGTGIVHIALDPAAESRLLWSAFDPTVLTVAEQPSVIRPFSRDQLHGLLAGILLPPEDDHELRFLEIFRQERLRNFQPRIEYPLLLMAAGIRRFRARDLTLKHGDAQTREEWKRYRKGCFDAHGISAPIDLLEDHYFWADRLATNLGQTYRSGHIFNFVLGAIAVCMGLATLMAPQIQLQEAILEMLITVAIIINATTGSKREWHRRWLDYRQLAERLRPRRSLKLLGIAAPDPPGTATSPVPRRWLDWYAASIWRAIGLPSASLDDTSVGKLGVVIAEHEVKPQIEYHERNAAQVQMLDHRLGRIGLALFAATLAVSVATLIGFAAHADYINTYNGLFMLIQAGFPALGTAVFGIRFQGDFGGDAVRSLNTAATLEHLAEELEKGVNLSRAADVTQQCARIMLADLDEWRLINQQRELDVG